jgi:hypothetical protein
MQMHLKNFDVVKWADDFIRELISPGEKIKLNSEEPEKKKRFS